jgi:hypothetical protein
MSEQFPPDGYVSLTDAARRISRDDSLLRRMVKEGRIPAYQIGTRWVVSEPVVTLLAHVERRPGRPWYESAARNAWQRELFHTAARLVPRPESPEPVRRAGRTRCATGGCLRLAAAGGLCTPCASGSDRCIEPGCTEQVRVAGHCRRHYGQRYQQARARRTLHPSTSPSGRARRTRCTAEGCMRLAVADGLCTPCTRGSDRCIEQGCTDPGRITGYCTRHYEQRYRRARAMRTLQPVTSRKRRRRTASTRGG